MGSYKAVVRYSFGWTDPHALLPGIYALVNALVAEGFDVETALNIVEVRLDVVIGNETRNALLTEGKNAQVN